MSNLVIIGNGFDMAHGLRTSYSNFIEYLVNSKFNDQKLYTDLFEFTERTKLRYNSYANIKENYSTSLGVNLFKSNSLIFNRLTSQLFDFNWCDIERQYFTELSSIGKENMYQSARKLNSDFNIIKKYLSDYLKKEQTKFEENWVYEQYFENISFEDSLILNFNYTNTIFNYVKSYSMEIVHIHGILDSEDNPIIFGYAADDQESRKLLQFEDKEFMRNIKKHNYKRTNEENNLIKFLESNKDIEVSIIGHSCGLSDKLILNQIFNNPNVSKIRLFYHKGYEHFFETQVNVDRIMNNDSNFNKLINFQDSLFIPQKNHTVELDYFSEKIRTILEERKKLLSAKHDIR